MKKLKNIGFIKVGEWKIIDDYFAHTIEEYLAEKKILYSFVSENDVLYIGKTTNYLKSRMSGYKNPHSSQKTNFRVKAKIIELLNSGNQVSIYILIDRTEFKFGDYSLCLASGLEDTLIADIKPKWNDRGVLKS
ncbi:hypothetical protein [Flavobacterium sp.]|uniref:hypothetical protein n=1 Tax=Flavobacterium sp. TaxID=239 RepID=UPI002608980F|nr:hypothetical protein [Flavobacterium sp.]